MNDCDVIIKLPFSKKQNQWPSRVSQFMYIRQIFSNKGIKLRRKNYVCCLSLKQRPNDIEIYKTLKKKAGKYQSSKQCFTFFSNAQKHVRKRYRPADFF